jgi:hypothetical protein
MRVAMTVQNIAGAAAGTGSESNDGAESDNQKNGTEGTPASKGDDGELGEKGKAALDKERTARREAERRAKDGDAAMARLKEIEDAQKSEQQKLTERAEKAEREAAEAKVSLMRRDVAADKQLPPAMADRLRGTTREELEADADELLKMLPAPGGDPKPKGAPQPPAGDNGPQRAKSLAEAISKRMTPNS